MAEEKHEKEDAGPAPSAKNPLLVILVLVNTIAVGAVGFFQFQNHKKLNSVTTAADVMKQDLEGGGEHAAAAEGGGHGEKKAEGGHGGGHGGAEAKAEVEGVKADGLLYPLEPFTANLAQGDGPRRFIRISLVLKFSKETKKEEVDARKPQISDTIISMLNAKKPEELLKKEGKEYLKEEVKTSINNFLVDGQVTDIYYVGFQIN